jgi:iron(III) transport system ATP-binding protein
MTPVTLRGLTKRFGSTVAVDRIDLDIPSGSLFFLLGPSGCGKTTLLRMIAGFTEPTEGTIAFGDRDVTLLPVHKRNTGMVFQGYALWPHMTVRQNVAFGLGVGPRKGKYSAAERDQRVEQALRTVQMQAYIDRRPNALSGGQQQRVALARALVVEPTVLLLDEPLSNLDAKLRLQMRQQIKQICNNAGITAIYVTHDQKEALSMADQIAVIRDGKVVQQGEPASLYHRPNSRFVADFLGETNFLSAEIKGRQNGRVLLECPAGQIESSAFPDDLPTTGNVTCSIRPEALRLLRDAADSPSPNQFEAAVTDRVYLGEVAQYQMTLSGSVPVKAFELNPRPMDVANGRLAVAVDADDVVILQD